MLSHCDTQPPVAQVSIEANLTDSSITIGAPERALRIIDLQQMPALSSLVAMERFGTIVQRIAGHPLQEARTSVGDRLGEFEKLERGWFEGSGESFSREHLKRASVLLNEVIRCGAPQPYVYPLPDGLIRAEWPLKRDGEIIVEIPASGALYALAIIDGEPKEEQAKLDETQLADFVTRHLGA